MYSIKENEETDSSQNTFEFVGDSFVSSENVIPIFPNGSYIW